VAAAGAATKRGLSMFVCAGETRGMEGIIASSQYIASLYMWPWIWVPKAI